MSEANMLSGAQDNKEYLTVEDAAKKLDVTSNRIMKWFRAGKFPHSIGKDSRDLRIPIKDLEGANSQQEDDDDEETSEALLAAQELQKIAEIKLKTAQADLERRSVENQIEIINHNWQTIEQGLQEIEQLKKDILKQKDELEKKQKTLEIAQDKSSKVYKEGEYLKSESEIAIREAKTYLEGGDKLFAQVEISRKQLNEKINYYNENVQPVIDMLLVIRDGISQEHGFWQDNQKIPTDSLIEFANWLEGESNKIIDFVGEIGLSDLKKNEGA